MSDLVEFLLARIAEREAAARDRDYEWLTRHDSAMKPEVLLAECEAKRRIVAEHEMDFINVLGESVCYSCAGGWGFNCPYPCNTLRFLALPYADHPDYRQEWRP